MRAAFAALQGWSLKEIEDCPLPVLRMAIEAVNERLDDNNRLQAQFHGIKVPPKAKAFVKQDSNEMSRSVKEGLMNGATVKKFTRAQLKALKEA